MGGSKRGEGAIEGTGAGAVKRLECFRSEVINDRRVVGTHPCHGASP